MKTSDDETHGRALKRWAVLDDVMEENEQENLSWGGINRTKKKLVKSRSLSCPEATLK